MITVVRNIFFLPLIAIALSACSTTSEQAQSSQLSQTNKETSNSNGKVSARFVPEREDDFAWENDKVAFRVYGPLSSGKGAISGVDAWFKSVDYPIVDKWYKQHLSGKSYHVDHGEGYDIYHTGSSRGVGGSAIWIEGKPYPAAAFISSKVLSNDGNSVSFELSYEWSTPLGKVNENKIISLSVGEQLYQVKSQFLLNGKPSKLPIAIGLTTHDGKASHTSMKEKGIISTWELMDDKAVGTAAIISPEKLNRIEFTSSEVKDTSHIWMITSSDDNGMLEYSAGFAWSGAGIIKTKQDWHNYLDN